MKIDAHQHFWKYNPEEYGWINDDMLSIKRDFLPEHLKPLLEENGFDGCVAVQARQSLEETRFLLQLADGNDFIKGVVGWVDLQSEAVEDSLTEFVRNRKLKGVRHVIQDEPDDEFILREGFLRGISLLSKFHLAYDILVFPKQLPHVVTFLDKFPGQPFVIDHLAKPDIASGRQEPWARYMREIARHPYVMCKLSGMVTEATWKTWKPTDFQFYLETVFDAFGEDRLMIGSDWPVCLLAANNYKEVMGIVSKFLGEISAEAQKKILGINAINFYKL